MKLLLRCVFTLALAGALVPLVARAEPDTLSEVVISSTLRDTPLNQLPASVTVLSGQVMDAAGNSHFGDVLDLVPNLNFAGGTSRPRYLQLRGIGELDQYEGAPNPSVGFLIDGIDFSGIAMPAALFDTARAEVLRGPQGTLLGANALAGLVSITSQAPTDRAQLQAQLEAGDYGVRGAGVIANDTLGAGDAAWRIAAHVYKGDGFRHNLFLNRKDTNGFDEDLVRGKLRWSVNSQLQADLTLLWSSTDNGYDAWTIDNTRLTQSDRPGRDVQRTRAAALKLDWTGIDGVRLLSTSTVADSTIRYSFDGDWGNEPFWGINGPYDFYERTLRSRRTWSQEVRAASTNTQGLRWVAGVYALHLTEGNDLLDLYNGDVYRTLVSDYAATNLALYGQADLDVAPQWLLSAGLRAERRDARYGDSNVLSFKPADTMMGGHLTLTRSFDDNRSAYASLNRGYKAGGFNLGAALPSSLRRFGPEALWNLETGYKARWADGAIETQSSLFYMRRQDQQVSSSYQADPTDPLTFVFITANAAKGENYGAESQWTWQLQRAWRFGANVGLLRARYIDYMRADMSLSGRDQPHAPHWQFSVSADWQGSTGLYAHADVNGKDAFYFSAGDDQRTSAYALVNLRAGYRAERWSINAWARNLLDQHYVTRGFYFGNEPPDFAPKRYVDNGDPRQAGISASFVLY